MTFSDDVLSSYLDGEAGPTLSREIEAAMAADPVLVARMERLGQNDGLLREAFDEALGETPARLTAALRPLAPPGAKILTFRPRGRPTTMVAWPHLAAASVTALMVGTVIGFSALPRPQALVTASHDSGVVAGARLASALASTPSGGEAQVGAEKLSVALSFKSNDGRLCRQFRLGSAGTASEGVACRAKNGWRIEGWMTGAAGAGGEAYQTAGGPESSPIGSVVDRLGVARTLDRQAEAAAIRADWR